MRNIPHITVELDFIWKGIRDDRDMEIRHFNGKTLSMADIMHYFSKNKFILYFFCFATFIVLILLFSLFGLKKSSPLEGKWVLYTEDSFQSFPGYGIILEISGNKIKAEGDTERIIKNQNQSHHGSMEFTYEILSDNELLLRYDQPVADMNFCNVEIYDELPVKYEYTNDGSKETLKLIWDGVDVLLLDNSSKTSANGSIVYRLGMNGTILGVGEREAAVWYSVAQKSYSFTKLKE